MKRLACFLLVAFPTMLAVLGWDRFVTVTGLR